MDNHRILCFGFNDVLVQNLVPTLAAEVAYVFWVRDKVGREGVLPTNIEAIDFQEAYQANLSDSPIADLPRVNLEDDAFSCYFELRPKVLKMIERLEKHGPKQSYDTRVYTFHSLFTYWYSFLKSKKINYYVGSNVPHEITDFVITEICRLLGIGCVTFLQTEVDLTMPHSHYTQIGTEGQRRYSLLNEQEEEQLRKTVAFRKEWYRVIGEGGDVNLFYMKKSAQQNLKKADQKFKSRRLKAKLKQFSAGILEYDAWRYLFYLTIERKILNKFRNASYARHYARLATDEPDLDQDYIYLGLHYQPEMTTNPLAEEFVNQYLMVEVLLAAFPEHVKIYIKDHPNQKHENRPKYYFKQFPASERVVFVRTEISSQRLQRHSLAVATATGTLGFEAIWSKKPALIFGNAYYQLAPGAFRVRSVAEAIVAADKIMNKEVSIQFSDLEQFYDDLANGLLPVNTSTYYNLNSTLALSPDENDRRLIKEIVARMKSNEQ